VIPPLGISLRKFAVAVGLSLLLTACEEPEYYAGSPPGEASLALRFSKPDTLDTTNGVLWIRHRYSLTWKFPSEDLDQRKHTLILESRSNAKYSDGKTPSRGGYSSVEKFDHNISRSIDSLVDSVDSITSREFYLDRPYVKAQLFTQLSPSDKMLLASISGNP
jgi:hypothetical protein